ncbi:hypothetical protein fugu_003983 [Takifugu bimaculatus]|uniref:Uncharacterized protein n=1 Tax=Takifugu bimaculatus TaxID=433685 RepID=A0A4Z2BCT2_9TELE|nr:hypothetical protein fugu_003983 [Takifugu bimaculatus]
MSPPLAPRFISLPLLCRPIPPRCSLFLFVFTVLDDALPVTAPLHHFSHPLHEQDAERAEEGGLQKDCEDEMRGTLVPERDKKKKKEGEGPCQFLAKCCC